MDCNSCMCQRHFSVILNHFTTTCSPGVILMRTFTAIFNFDTSICPFPLLLSVDKETHLLCEPFSFSTELRLYRPYSSSLWHLVSPSILKSITLSGILSTNLFLTLPPIWSHPHRWFNVLTDLEPSPQPF